MAIATLNYWFGLSFAFVDRQKARWKVYFVNCLTGLALPILALFYLALSTDTSFVEILNYAKNKWLFDEVSFESLFNYNLLVIITFLVIFKDLGDRTILVMWTNGNLAVPLIYVFWPKTDAEGWSCNGQFLAEKQGYLGSSCAGVELDFHNISTYDAHLQTAWGLDRSAVSLIELAGLTGFIVVGLVGFGSLHYLLKRPNLA
ncbi:MAG: hypothetical protein CMM73_04935 [Rhodospirillaceae bacterium]|nr:hypothetical protein [Rhodospirillaceae bacterium]